ncbi:MAG: phosphohistidine phosphatase SixA [Deltaproteobacteria bacterium]|nr:phosphohistidine phosphatase SixA [Deltaproteobacteria bacterium]
MLLHILRHAEAEALSPSGLDADRALTDSGAKRMKLVARAISRMEPGFDAILVSPLLRARQTAEPVAAACRFKGELTITEALLPGSNPTILLEELERTGGKSVLVVGHEPHLGNLVGRLVSGRKDVEVPMKKAALAIFEIHPLLGGSRAELKSLLTPRLLESL